MSDFQQINKDFIERSVEPQKEHSWAFIFFTYIVYMLVICIIVFGLFEYEILNFIQLGTNHIIHVTLVVSLLLFAVTIGIIVKKKGQIPLRDLGLKLQQLKEGLLFYAALYIGYNLVVVILNLALAGTPNFSPYWEDRGLVYYLGFLAGQIFGNVLVEETYYRGYLLPQMIKKFHANQPEAEFKSIFLGIVLSNILFSLLHIPIRLYTGVTGSDLLYNLFLLMGVGVIYALMYVLTNNLYIAMAVHIMSNITFALFSPVFSIWGLTFWISFLLVVVIIKVRYKAQNHEFGQK